SRGPQSGSCSLPTVVTSYFSFFFFQAEDGIRDPYGDWSSDVCSSDLAPQPPVAAVPSPPKADSSVLKGLQSTQSFPEEYGFQLLAAIALWTAALAGGIGLALVVGQKL